MPGDCKLSLIATSEDTGPLTKALVSVESGKNLLAYRDWIIGTIFKLHDAFIIKKKLFLVLPPRFVISSIH